jgi:hypothetical protein
MMSLLKKKPRYEVISIRLNEDRLKLLERYQRVLGDQLGREVSLGEAAFLVIEERGAGLDRETMRHEMLSTPTSSLYHIRKKWESQHTLSATGITFAISEANQLIPSSLIRTTRRYTKQF